MIWFWQAGGLELAQELYSKYGIVWFPHSVTGPESGQRSNKPIKTGDDYKGVKMRQCGRVQAKILQDLGGAAIFMPGSEIYLALSRGTIDAAEFSVPGVDWSMGFQEVTKYWVLPGGTTGPGLRVMINAAWDKASDRVKFLAAKRMASMMWAWTFYELNAADYTQKSKESIQTNIPDQDAINKITDIAYKYPLKTPKRITRLPFAGEIPETSRWRSIEQPFMFGRNPPSSTRSTPSWRRSPKAQGLRCRDRESEGQPCPHGGPVVLEARHPVRWESGCSGQITGVRIRLFDVGSRHRHLGTSGAFREASNSRRAPSTCGGWS
jgi:hypothetical protein